MKVHCLNFVLLSLLVWSCNTSEWEMNREELTSEDKNILTEEFRTYFEEHLERVYEPDFKTLEKGILPETHILEELFPGWEESCVSETEEFYILTVALSGTSVHAIRIISQYKPEDTETKRLQMDIIRKSIHSYLIFMKDKETGDFSYQIVTSLEDPPSVSSKAQNCWSNCMIYSDKYGKCTHCMIITDDHSYPASFTSEPDLSVSASLEFTSFWFINKISQYNSELYLDPDCQSSVCPETKAGSCYWHGSYSGANCTVCGTSQGYCSTHGEFFASKCPICGNAGYCIMHGSYSGKNCHACGPNGAYCGYHGHYTGSKCVLCSHAAAYKCGSCGQILSGNYDCNCGANPNITPPVPLYPGGTDPNKPNPNPDPGRSPYDPFPCPIPSHKNHDPDEDYSFPHPEDCTKYFMCIGYLCYMRDCPFSLHFNADLLVCQFPWDADCERMDY